MGTIAQKLTYLNGTKQALKESINNLGGDITNETTFREYAQELDNIYDNLPKTTGEDTSLSLTTLKGKMNIIPKGDTKQTQYEGYNELNIYAVHPKGYTETVNGVTIKYNDNGSVTATGTATADISYFLGSRASLGDMFNGTYYLSGCTNGSLTTYFLQMWAETSGTYQQTTTEVATNKVSGKNWNVTIQIKNGASVNYTFYPMMSKTSGKSFEPFVGGTASPNPTYPQNIEVVTGTQDVKVSGNEFAEIETQTLNGMKITKTDNGYILNGTASANTTFRATITNPTNSNKTLCVKCDTAITNANIQVKTRSSTYTQLRSISLGNANTWVVSSGTFEDYYCDIYIKSGTTLSNVLVQPMLLEGTFTTSNLGKYQPYNEEQTQQVSLGDIELCKIGNYQDYLEYDVENDKVYLNKNVNEHTFTESENISLQSINSYGIANFFIPHSLGSVSNLALCNYFTLQTSGISVTQEEGFLWQHNGVYFRIKSSTASDVSSFKTWLGFHSVKIEYALAETNKEEITGTLATQIKALYNSQSFNGTTNINSSGSLPMILNVSAIKGE